MGRWSILLLLMAVVKIVTSQTPELNETLYQKFALFEQYAAASYCAANNNGSAKKIHCTTGNCPLVEEATTLNVVGFANSPQNDVHGFIAHDDTHKSTVISFRGSESMKNWESNLDAWSVVTNLCEGCLATRGFWGAWNESRVVVLAAINATVKAFPQHRIVSVGHSLGAAIATLAAAELRNTGLVVDLYTYGSPRVCNPALARWMEAQAPDLGVNYRMTHYNDPVPAVPLVRMGYSHIGPEYYINTKNKLPVEMKNITIVDETDSAFGNAQWHHWDTDAHVWYFNAITQCYKDADPVRHEGFLESIGLSSTKPDKNGVPPANATDLPAIVTPPNANSTASPNATSTVTSGKTPSKPLSASLGSIYDSLLSLLGLKRNHKIPPKIDPWLQLALDQLEEFNKHQFEQRPWSLTVKRSRIAHRGVRG